MCATEREKELYGGNIQIISRSPEQAACCVADESGELVMTGHADFSGIDLVYSDAHATRCHVSHAAANVMEVTQCREGAPFIVRSKASVAHIFSALYTVPARYAGAFRAICGLSPAEYRIRGNGETR